MWSHAMMTLLNDLFPKASAIKMSLETSACNSVLLSFLFAWISMIRKYSLNLKDCFFKVGKRNKPHGQIL